MRVDKKNTQPIAGQPRNTQPVQNAEPRVHVATDALTLTSKAPAEPHAPAPNAALHGSNVLDNSFGRKLADGTNAAAGMADGARGLKPAADTVRAASEAGRFGGLTSRLSTLMDRGLGIGARLGDGVKWLAPVATGLAKAAPFLGVGIALLDIGKAAIEENPEKKLKAQGMAVLSGVTGLAGVVAAGGAMGAVAFGVALAPLAVPAMIIGGVATVVALTDQFLLGGTITKGIGSGMNVIGDAAGRAWSSLFG